MLNELLIALGAGEYYIYPYAHRFRRRGDKKQRSFDCLDTERGLWTRTVRPPLVVDKHVLDRLEPDEDTVGALLRLVGVVLQAALCTVEHEPASFPLFDRGASAQLGQVAMTGARC